MTSAPCGMCAIETDERVEPVPRYSNAGVAMGSYLLGLCDPCLTLRPNEVGSGVRAALRLLGRPEYDPDAGQAFLDAGIDVSHVLYRTWAAKPGADIKPGRKPWAHVPKAMKADLRAAYASMLRDRVTAEPPAPEPPSPEYPPACLACGIGKSLTWHGPLHAYGLTTGPEPVDGVMCSVCVQHLEATGAVGQPFLERAVMAYNGIEYGENVRIPGLQAWVATGRPPEVEPWAWVDLQPSAPDLDPLSQVQDEVYRLRGRVEDLEAQVAVLRRESVL